jgi:hypothetical protein
VAGSDLGHVPPERTAEQVNHGNGKSDGKPDGKASRRHPDRTMPVRTPLRVALDSDIVYSTVGLQVKSVAGEQATLVSTNSKRIVVTEAPDEQLADPDSGAQALYLEPGIELAYNFPEQKK